MKNYTLVDAYSDCNELSKQDRNLHFKALPCTFKALCRAFSEATPDGYNEFSPARLEDASEYFAATFGKDAEYSPAREGSACIYVRPARAVWLEDLASLKTKLNIDEVTLETDGNVRLWWD